MAHRGACSPRLQGHVLRPRAVAPGRPPGSRNVPTSSLHSIISPVVSVPVLSSTNAYRSLGRALRLTRVAAAPDVVSPQDDASQDGLRGDGCRDRFLHAELKLLAENPPLRARAPREPCTGPIEAHGKQFFIATLEEVGSLAIICISHGCLLASTRHQHRLIPGGQLLRACTV